MKIENRGKENLVNEVKKTGLLIDRGQALELRSGDTVLLYVSMGGFEKWWNKVILTLVKWLFFRLCIYNNIFINFIE